MTININGTVDITNLKGAVVNELDSSLLLTVGNGVTVNPNGTYTVSPNGIGLATYDNWIGTLTNPDPSDTVSFNTFIPSSNPTPGVVEYYNTDGDGSLNPPSGGIGAGIIAWNSTGVLLEQLNGYVPGPNAIITPDGEFFVLSTVDLSVAQTGTEQATPAELTFGTDPSVPIPVFSTCFLTGVGIATPSGDVLVESLAVGDLVLTASGAVRPIEWIGTGNVLTTRGRRTAATPVIVRKGALAHNVPNRDLHVTKGHSFLIDGVLIPVEFLVNHRSILWDDHAPKEVTLYHIELQIHDVLLANGAPAESYRDDGNRWLFRNAGRDWDQPAMDPCAPVLTGGPVVDAIWRRLLDRAGPRPGLLLSTEPDLHLSVDGMRIDAASDQVGISLFRLSVPTPFTALRIVSRAASPAELGLARDPRVLGVAIRRVVLRHGQRARMIDAADPRLVQGFHAYEPDATLRWTDGDATLPIDLFDGFFGHSIDLELHTTGSTTYIEDGLCSKAA